MTGHMDTAVFSSDKATVLNALYDVIESLGLSARHINSERGVMLIRTPGLADIRITVDTVFPSKKTRVGAAAPPENDWSRIILDELGSILTHCHSIEEDTL